MILLVNTVFINPDINILYYLLLGRKTFWNKLLSKTMTSYKNREFKHDVYSRRRTPKITSEFVCFSSNPQQYQLRKNRKMSPTIHRNCKYSYSTQKTSENRQQLSFTLFLITLIIFCCPSFTQMQNDRWLVHLTYI